MQSTALALWFATLDTFSVLYFDNLGLSVPLKKDDPHLKRCLLFNVSARNPVATNTVELSVASQHNV
jgi:hypothetical protein